MQVVQRGVKEDGMGSAGLRRMALRWARMRTSRSGRILARSCEEFSSSLCRLTLRTTISWLAGLVLTTSCAVLCAPTPMSRRKRYDSPVVEPKTKAYPGCPVWMQPGRENENMAVVSGEQNQVRD